MTTPISLPRTQRAIVANPQLDYSIREDAPLPPLIHDCIIIKTQYVGLNPVDTKMVGPFVGVGAGYGVDCAGVVVAIGSAIPDGRFSIGDRVAGCADGMEPLRPWSGAFAEYVSVNAGMAFKLPEDMEFDVAAGMPLRVATSTLAIFHSMGITPTLLDAPLTEEAAFDVLVYGGGTSTGTLAIQLLKMCGIRVLAVCSQRSFGMVKGFGADECFDYNDLECGQKIRDFTHNALDYALDCITEEGTMKICYQALGRCGGKYTGLEPLPGDTNARRAVQADWILVSWMSGKPVSWPRPFGTENGKPEYRDFATKVMPQIQQLFESGKFRPHPTRTEPSGFEGVIEGARCLRQGKVKGQKLVYRTEERRDMKVDVAA